MLRFIINRNISAAETDHTDYDCFLLAVLSHGEMNMLYAKDVPYKPDELWKPFTSDRCPTLAGNWILSNQIICFGCL